MPRNFEKLEPRRARRMDQKRKLKNRPRERKTDVIIKKELRERFKIP